MDGVIDLIHRNIRRMVTVTQLEIPPIKSDQSLEGPEPITTMVTGECEQTLWRVTGA